RRLRSHRRPGILRILGILRRLGSLKRLSSLERLGIPRRPRFLSILRLLGNLRRLGRPRRLEQVTLEGPPRMASKHAVLGYGDPTMGRMRTTAVDNNNGGTGKNTTSDNVASIAAS